MHCWKYANLLTADAIQVYDGYVFFVYDGYNITTYLPAFYESWFNIAICTKIRNHYLLYYLKNKNFHPVMLSFHDLTKILVSWYHVHSLALHVLILFSLRIYLKTSHSSFNRKFYLQTFGTRYRLSYSPHIVRNSYEWFNSSPPFRFSIFLT